MLNQVVKKSVALGILILDRTYRYFIYPYLEKMQELTGRP